MDFPTTITISEQIRNMSDEDLAEFLNYIGSCETCRWMRETNECCMDNEGSCVSGIIKWLQESVQLESKEQIPWFKKK